MAFPALCGSGIEGESLLVDGGNGSLLAFLGFCRRGKYINLTMASRFRRGQLLFAGDHATGVSGRSSTLDLGKPQSELCLHGLRLLSLAGTGDSILAKERCVTQYGSCESAAEHRIAHSLIPHRFQGSILIASPPGSRPPRRPLGRARIAGRQSSLGLGGRMLASASVAMLDQMTDRIAPPLN
jgi:hypothetical protein